MKQEEEDKKVSRQKRTRQRTFKTAVFHVEQVDDEYTQVQKFIEDIYN